MHTPLRYITKGLVFVFCVLVMVLAACKTDELSKDMKFAPYKGKWVLPLGTRTETIDSILNRYPSEEFFFL